MGLGKQIRKYRQKLGLTLQQLAELSGVDTGTISALEQRDSSRSQYFSDIAKSLGLSVEELGAEKADFDLVVARDPTQRVIVVVKKIPGRPDPHGIFAWEQELLSIWRELPTAQARMAVLNSARAVKQAFGDLTAEDVAQKSVTKTSIPADRETPYAEGSSAVKGPTLVDRPPATKTPAIDAEQEESLGGHKHRRVSGKGNAGGH